MIERLESKEADLLVVKLSGKLVVEDYDKFNNWSDSMLKDHDQFRLLCVLDDFHGWGEAAAVWADAKFGMKYRKDISKFGMIGDKNWESWMAKAAGYFMPGQVKYFDVADKQAAYDWISTNG